MRERFDRELLSFSYFHSSIFLMIKRANRYFPILEIYDATDDEKNALRQKLLYNGMTVGKINTISAYIQEDKTYIKAQLIRLLDIAEDTHIINEIANELYKGVYI